MTTALTILGTSGLFVLGVAARGALVLAVFAALALPIAATSWVLHAVAERWRRLGAHHGEAAHAHR